MRGGSMGIMLFRGRGFGMVRRYECFEEELG
jgi:hypothetical protein